MNTVYCMFEDDESFEEFYDIAADPYQLQNVAFHSDVTQVNPQLHHHTDFPEHPFTLHQAGLCPRHQGTVHEKNKFYYLNFYFK